MSIAADEQFGPSLRARGAAYAVMQHCLDLQSTAGPRSRLARTLGRNPLHAEAHSWYRGTLGELEVARVLAQLGPAWTVLHAVPVGSRDADIDHVLIGPGGVFTINTKNHSGKRICTAGSTFMVSGKKLPHIRNSLFEAKRAGELLSAAHEDTVAVTPLIVVVHPESIRNKKSDVAVVSSTEVLRFLGRRPRTLTDAAISRISQIAEQRTTWSSVVAEHNDISSHEQRFERLRAEVRTAAGRRRAWALVGAASFLAVVFAATLALTPFIPRIMAALMGDG